MWKQRERELSSRDNPLGYLASGPSADPLHDLQQAGWEPAPKFPQPAFHFPVAYLEYVSAGPAEGVKRLLTLLSQDRERLGSDERPLVGEDVSERLLVRDERLTDAAGRVRDVRRLAIRESPLGECLSDTTYPIGIRVGPVREELLPALRVLKSLPECLRDE